MAENRLSDMEERLSSVPPGQLLVERHTPQQDAPHLWEDGTYTSDGKGIIAVWTLFPGIVLTHSVYRAGQYAFSHPPLASVLQINHCRLGRVGWETRDGSIFLGPGDLSLHRMDACAQSAMCLPLGFYEGIAMLVDLDVLEREPPDILREAGIHGQALYEKFCGAKGYTAMPADPQIDHIFSQLYTLPPHFQLPYFRLKAQELLLFLSMLEPEEKALDQYRSRQVEIIQAIHRQLTEHLDRRYTIEELSKEYLLNTSSLKAIFKRVYGAPIAAYMKEYRIREAARLLRETRDSVGSIAAQVGYENQSKFSAAFQDIMKTLPTVYRRQRQEIM